MHSNAIFSSIDVKNSYTYQQIVVLYMPLSLRIHTYDQKFFFFGGEGVVDGEGRTVKVLEVGWWEGWRSLRDLCKNIQKQGVGKGKSCS